MITKEDLIDIGFRKETDMYGDLWLQIDREISIQFIEHRLVFWCANHTRDLNFSDAEQLKFFVNIWLNGFEFQSDATHEEESSNWLKTILIALILASAVFLIVVIIKR